MRSPFTPLDERISTTTDPRVYLLGFTTASEVLAGDDVRTLVIRPDVCDRSPAFSDLFLNEVISKIYVLRLCRPKGVVRQMDRSFVVFVYNHLTPLVAE